MRLRTELYLSQLARWPQVGRHILAQFDDQHIVVYQAYRPSIADYAVRHGRFGGEFSFGRMSWIKPNFLWMMYRSGWASKEGQERILALTIPITAFEEILTLAVPSSFTASVGTTPEEWREAVARSDVRLQWDPDHAPNGSPTARRALQLGLRGESLRRFSDEWLVSVEDITPFVLEQRARTVGLGSLVTPSEAVYGVANAAAARRIGLSPPE